MASERQTLGVGQARTVAVTGATGFIGRELVRRLAADGWRVRALVRPVSAVKQPDAPGVHWVSGDLEDLESLRRLVAGTCAVVHCAGAVRGLSPLQFNRANVDGTGRLVHAVLSRMPKPRFLLISSLAARAPGLSDYARSKRLGEKVLETAGWGLPWDVFRPPAVYGPGDRELKPLFRWMVRARVAPLFVPAANRLSLLFVTDLAEAIICWLDRAGYRRYRYELDDGRVGGYTWKDIVETTARVSGRSIVLVRLPAGGLKAAARLNRAAARSLGRCPMLTPGKVREMIHPDWVADGTTLGRDTGWSPRVALAEGLRLTLGTKDGIWGNRGGCP